MPVKSKLAMEFGPWHVPAPTPHDRVIVFVYTFSNVGSYRGVHSVDSVTHSQLAACGQPAKINNEGISLLGKMKIPRCRLSIRRLLRRCRGLARGRRL